MMKKILVIFFCAFYSVACQKIVASSVSFAVPKQSLIDRSSLVLLMVDCLGNECVGTCQLGQEFETRNIVQQDLLIKSETMLDQLPGSIDVTDSLQPCNNEVLLHIEFDKDLKVLKILVVKDSLLADNPFDILSISVNNSSDIEDDCDELSELLDGLDVSEAIESMPVQQYSYFEECKLRLQVLMALQYSYAKRKLNNWVSWLCDKN